MAVVRSEWVKRKKMMARLCQGFQTPFNGELTFIKMMVMPQIWLIQPMVPVEVFWDLTEVMVRKLPVSVQLTRAVN